MGKIYFKRRGGDETTLETPAFPGELDLSVQEEPDAFYAQLSRRGRPTILVSSTSLPKFEVTNVADVNLLFINLLTGNGHHG